MIPPTLNPPPETRAPESDTLRRYEDRTETYQVMGSETKNRTISVLARLATLG